MPSIKSQKKKEEIIPLLGTKLLLAISEIANYFSLSKMILNL